MRAVKYIHFTHPKKDTPTYGILEDGEIQTIKGNLFQRPSAATEIIPLTSVQEYLPPVYPPNILAIGLNYRGHVKEGGQPLPKEPILFLKASTSVIGHRENIILPRIAPSEVDYEAELAVIIGQDTKNVAENKALDYVFGYTCGNDVSARDCQLKKDGQWARGKSFDTFCPLGPWIETDLDPANLKIQARLNHQLMQDSNVNEMIFSIEMLISYLSHCMTLLPGTVIMTGTPQGVGFARDPPVYLKPGDTVEIIIEEIGALQNPVISEEDWPTS